MRDANPSRTAQYVAAMRTVLTGQGDLDDPHASGMLGPSMRLSVAAVRLPVLRRWTTSGFYAAIATRIAWTDREVQRAIDDGIQQVVIVGAGFDSRAWRLAAPGVRFFELDHPATQADKRRRAPAGDGPTYVPVDLSRSTVQAALAGAVAFDATKPAVFVVEGVTMYLTPEQVTALFRDLAGAAGAGSRLVTQFAVGPQPSGRVVDRWFGHVLRLVGRLVSEPHLSFADTSTAGSLVASAGWPEVHVVGLREVAPELLAPTHLRLDAIAPGFAAVVARTLR